MSSGPEVLLELLRMRKVTVPVPRGIHVPMCFCGDDCKLVQCKVVGDVYGMRFWMCNNYDHSPIKPFGNVRPKVCNTCSIYDLNLFSLYVLTCLCAKTPPALCDFRQWLDTEQAQADKEHVQRTARSAAESWQRMLRAEQEEEKRKAREEEVRARKEAAEREAAEAREADRERKRERARRAKAAGPEAIRKGKYPRCTQ
jgi:hypothetical protein